MFLVFFLNLGSYIIIGTVTLVLARTKVNEHVQQIKEEFADFARWSWRPEDNSEFAGAGIAGRSWVLQTPGGNSGPFSSVFQATQVPSLYRRPSKFVTSGGASRLYLDLGLEVQPALSKNICSLGS